MSKIAEKHAKEAVNKIHSNWLYLEYREEIAAEIAPLIDSAIAEANKEKDEALNKIMLAIRDLQPSWAEIGELAQNALTEKELPTFEDVRGILSEESKK